MGQALQIPYDLLAQILHVIIFLLDEDGGSIDVAHECRSWNMWKNYFGSKIYLSPNEIYMREDNKALNYIRQSLARLGRRLSLFE